MDHGSGFCICKCHSSERDPVIVDQLSGSVMYFMITNAGNNVVNSQLGSSWKTQKRTRSSDRCRHRHAANTVTALTVKNFTQTDLSVNRSE